MKIFAWVKPEIEFQQSEIEIILMTELEIQCRHSLKLFLRIFPANHPLFILHQGRKENFCVQNKKISKKIFGLPMIKACLSYLFVIQGNYRVQIYF